MEDISIPIDENMSDDGPNIENNSDSDLEYVSRNKVLQDKYNENFHSNIISTGTVSIVVGNKKEKVIDRTKLFSNHDYYEEDGSSSHSQFSDDKFKSRGKASSAEQVKDESSERISSAQITKLVAKAFTNKLKNNSSEGHSTPSPMITTPFSVKDRSTSVGTRKEGKRQNSSDLKDKINKKVTPLSSKFNPKRLQRRGTFLFDNKSKKKASGQLKRTNHFITSVNTPKVNIRPKRFDKNDIEQMKARIEFVVNIEKSPYTEVAEIPDEFLDANYNLEEAIINARMHNAKKKKVYSEWSGQDIMPALEPHLVGISISQLNKIRVFRTGVLRPLYKMREYLSSIVKSSFFENFMTL